MLRKGGCTTNVACTCDSSCRIIFVAPGASGRATDSTVLTRSEALTLLDGAHGFFWLGDAGFGLSHKLLTPYQVPGLRYHLKV